MDKLTKATAAEIKRRDKLVLRWIAEGITQKDIVEKLKGKHKKPTGRTNWTADEVSKLIKKLTQKNAVIDAEAPTTVSESDSIAEAVTEQVLHLSRCYGAFNDTNLVEWNVTLASLVEELRNPKEGVKGTAGYFLRCAGTKRNNTDTSDTADILILDGDKKIDTTTGEELNYAPPLDDVANALKSLNIPFVAYNSASNQPDKPKYRVLIPCRYNRDNLKSLLNFIFTKLHEAGVMLVDVPENRTWSQPWYFPTVDVEGGAV